MKSDEEIQERLKGKEQIGKMIEEEKKMKTEESLEDYFGTNHKRRNRISGESPYRQHIHFIS